MKTIKKIIVLLSAFVLLTGFAPSKPIMEPNKYSAEISIDFFSAKPGDEFVIYSNPEKEQLVTITILNIKKGYSYSPYASQGDSGWSGGYIPDYLVTLIAQVKDGSHYFKYVVEAENGDIIDAHSLTYSVYLYDIVSSNLSYTSRRASFTFTAKFSVPWTTVHTFQGYLNLHVDSKGRVKTTWSV